MKDNYLDDNTQKFCKRCNGWFDINGDHWKKYRAYDDIYYDCIKYRREYNKLRKREYHHRRKIHLLPVSSQTMKIFRNADESLEQLHIMMLETKALFKQEDKLCK